jgi:hypothetical protein
MMEIMNKAGKTCKLRVGEHLARLALLLILLQNVSFGSPLTWAQMFLTALALSLARSSKFNGKESLVRVDG